MRSSNLEDPKIGCEGCDTCVDDCIPCCCLDHPCKFFWLAFVIQLLLAVVSGAIGALKIERVEGAWSIHQMQNTQYYWAWREASGKKDEHVPSPAPCAISHDNSRLLMSPYTNVTHDLDLDSLVDGDVVSTTGAMDLSELALFAQPEARRLEEEEEGEEEEETWSTFHFLYKTNKEGTGDIFTPDYFDTMCKFERDILKADGRITFVASLVMAVYGYHSSPYLEVKPADSFDMTHWTCEPKLTQVFIDSKVSEMKAAINAQGFKSPIASFVHPSFKDNGQSSYTRSWMTKDPVDGDKWEEVVFTKFGKSYGFLTSPYMAEEDRFLPLDNIRVRIRRDDMDEMNKMIYVDFSLVFGSFVFVFVVMYVYMKSAWMASWGMYQILLSLPSAALIYRILQIRYFEFLHILIVYLVLGIGADDIFVFVDTFRQISKHFPQDEEGAYCRQDFTKVMKITMMRSSTAIFNTTFTTTVAFLSSSISKVMPMRTCGWFAALCLIGNYILTMTFTPLTLSIYHSFFQKQRCCCPPCSYREQKPCRKLTVNIEEKTNGNVEAAEEQTDQNLGCLEKLLQRVYVPFMSRKMGPVRPGALFVTGVMLIVAIQGTAFTAQLTPPRATEVWVPNTHMTLDWNTFLSDHYATPDYAGYAEVFFFWGIKEYNIDGMDVYRPDMFNDGVVFDPEFDLTTREAQDAIRKVCQEMQTKACTAEGCGLSYGKLMMESADKSYTCFLEDMETYFGGPLPTGPSFIDKLKEFLKCAGDQKDKFGYGDVMGPDYHKNIGFVEGQLRFVAVGIRSTIRSQLPHSLGVKVRKTVDDYVKEWQSSAPAGMRTLKYHSNHLFANYDLGDELVSGLFSGCAISLPVAFFVLLFSTRNIMVSVIAVFSVGFIVLCVLGFCRSAMDWDLGIGEAIAGVIVIGYSVDYVVHLAHIYCESKHYGCQTRDARCRFAITNLGTTIFAGAITTAGSGAIMFLCFFYFFFKMALLITITIMFSFLFSLLFFMGILWQIGPENDFADLCVHTCSKNMDKIVPSNGEGDK